MSHSLMISGGLWFNDVQYIGDEPGNRQPFFCTIMIDMID